MLIQTIHLMYYSGFLEIAFPGGVRRVVPVGTVLEELASDHPPTDGSAPLVALLDDIPISVQTAVWRDARVEFVGITHCNFATQKEPILVRINAGKSKLCDNF